MQDDPIPTDPPADPQDVADPIREGGPTPPTPPPPPEPEPEK